jgi:integrase
MASEKLTKAVLDRLAPGAKVWDTQVRGLIADRGARGVSFRVQADLWQHGRLVRTHKSTLGRFGTAPRQLTIDQARAEAQRQLGAVHSGQDPKRPSDGSVWTLRAALDQYAADAIKARGDGARRTVDDMRARAERYLKDWLGRRLDTITPLECRQRHDQIRDDVKARATDLYEQREATIRAGTKAKPRRAPTESSGARAANQTLGDVRALIELAMKTFPAAFTSNPVAAVRFSRERKAHQCIARDDFGSWLAAVDALENPVRRVMHQVGLWSGVRPSNLLGMRVEWCDLQGRAVHYPAPEMKGRRAWALPLSPFLVELLREAIQVAGVMHRGSPFVFPSRDRDGRIIASQVTKEKALPSAWVGYGLRHSYSLAAELAGVDGDIRQTLMAQKVSGIRGTYRTESELFERLLSEQERVTAKLLELTKAK